MPGVASIVNKSVPDDAQIHQFYNTTNLNLALNLMPGNKGGNALWTVDPDQDGSHDGVLVDKTSLATARFTGSKLVFALTHPKPPSPNDETKYNVSIVSPGYMPLRPTEITNLSVGACSTDQEDEAFVGVDAQSLQLREFLVSQGDDRPYPDAVVRVGSALAAYWAGKPYVIYQGRNSPDLVLFSPQEDTAIPISNTGDARIGTTIAATYVNGKAYVYYTDTTLNVRRVVDNDGQWTPSKIDSDPVDETSQLAATTANGHNHLFYLASTDSGDKFTHHLDPL
ncbi:hypothetical protein EYZ11_008791 [Aspergillus tanneri]|uniref:Fucose-specific lectin n=1 Tax=Aspergillus tanneri TaxID=1220188 RepID=A0A4S3J9Q2_9EURO|nr:hypothetical protein EYZ11_008791 [Aspergillus tanneri]